MPNANTNPKSLHCELTDRANEIALFASRVRERVRKERESALLVPFAYWFVSVRRFSHSQKTVCPGRVLRTVSVFYSTFLWLFHPRLCIHSTSPPFTLPLFLSLSWLPLCLSVCLSVHLYDWLRWQPAQVTWFPGTDWSKVKLHWMDILTMKYPVIIYEASQLSAVPNFRSSSWAAYKQLSLIFQRTLLVLYVSFSLLWLICFVGYLHRSSLFEFDMNPLWKPTNQISLSMNIPLRFPNQII